MQSKEVLNELLNKQIEEYIKLDPKCSYIENSFYHSHNFEEENEIIKQWPYKPNPQLEEKKQKLEEITLEWLWHTEPTRKQFGGIYSEEVNIHFKDDINLEISNGIYYFSKTYYPRDEMKDAKKLTFAIIYPETKSYYHYTSYLQKLVLESFINKKQKIKKNK